MKPPEPTLVQKHYGYLDGMRAVLALYVMMHHAWYTVRDRDPGGLSGYFGFLGYGFYAVIFFIVVSGFCLMLPVLKTDYRLKDGAVGFFLRRAWRILPPYYFALVFSLGLIYLLIHERTGTHWDTSLPVTGRDLVVHVLLLQNLVPGAWAKINHVCWSVSLEWQIYFLFPLLLWGWRKASSLATVVAAMVMSKVAELVFFHFTSVASDLSFAGFFALGMFACHASYGEDKAGVNYRRAPWGWLSVIFGAAFFGELVFDKHVVVEPLCAVFAASLLIYVSLHPEGWLRRVLDLKPLVFVGGFSYSLYLIHAPLLQVLWQYVLAPWRAQTNLMRNYPLATSVAVE